ncbi:MAG: SUMF1/EgtB/PvdO family nonheme iron enzyme [Candidatus Poribacteria bacterium]|nr:SUMF1/EgtB/PvdO family nonheme iron enzyme [Candidatus Poribacteria bacterium]
MLPNTARTFYRGTGLLENVWEWYLDIYDPKFHLNSDNPHNPRSFGTPQVSTKYAVIRGGSWYQSNNQLRSENRNFANAKASLSHLGFGV